jgi:hypothetical protein
MCNKVERSIPAVAHVFSSVHIWYIHYGHIKNKNKYKKQFLCHLFYNGLILETNSQNQRT